MAQLAIAAVGAAIGSAAIQGTVLGLSGAAIGWTLGSIAGATLFPQRAQGGPRLGDLTVTGSAYGTPIPWVQGTPRIAGQIWWASSKRELRRTSGGKGGGPEVTTYSYEVDLLIGLCGRKILYIARIWSNGKLVWNVLDDSADDSISSSYDASLWRRMTIYTGESDQLPDATYEADVTTALAPGYRGRACVFFEGLQLGGSGQIPNLTFEVVVDGTLVYVDRGFLSQFESLEASNKVQADLGGPVKINLTGSDQALVSSPVKWGGYCLDLASREAATDSGGIDLTPGGSSWRVEGWFRTNSTAAHRLFRLELLPLPNYSVTVDIAVSGGFSDFTVNFARAGIFGGGGMGNGTYRPAVNTWFHVAVQYKRGGLWQFFALGRYIGTISGSGDPWPTGSAWTLKLGSAAVVGGRNVYVDSFQFRTFSQEEEATELYPVGSTRYTDVYTLPAGPFKPPPYAYALVAPNTHTLQETVEALCERAGMPAGTYDASALASINKPVRALALAQVAPTRGVLEQLCTAYFFEAYVTGKLYFVPRGGASAASVAWEYLAAGQDQAADQPLALTVSSDLERPPNAMVQYINASADYQPGTEYSDRVVSGQAATQGAQLALGLTPAEAKGIADAVVADTAAGQVTAPISLPMSFTKLVPSDVVTVTDEDSRTYRLRLVRRNDAAGVLGFDTVADDETAFDSAKLTDTGYTEAGAVTAYSSTLIEPMDIPLLRDADDGAGYYVAAKGSGTTWPGCQVYSSLDDVTYTAVADVAESSVFGTCSTTLGTFTDAGFDEKNKLTVNVGNGELSSSTRAAMLTNETVNAMLVGSEIIRFRTATLSSPGVYVLSGLLRGLRGTEWAIATHAANEPCVVLALTAGLRRVAGQVADLNAARYVKGVTLSALASAVASEAFTNTGIGLKPYAPSDLRIARDSANDATITWRRRSRYAHRFLAPGIDPPLAEASERYEVDIIVSAAVVRTISATAQTCAYSAADQTTDGITPGNPITARVYQLSASVGRGYVLEATR
jgi:hypothetical protein